MRENHLYEQIARYINLRHPDVMYHFDLSGVNNKSLYTRSLYSRLNGRAWPDLFIAKVKITFQEEGSYGAGLFLELKKEGTRVFKKDGSLVANEHVQEQARVLEQLNQQGYKAEFAVGFSEAQRLIDDYLKG